jgi:hypothetical protein
MENNKPGWPANMLGFAFTFYTPLHLIFKTSRLLVNFNTWLPFFYRYKTITVTCCGLPPIIQQQAVLYFWCCNTFFLGRLFKMPSATAVEIYF